MRVIFRDFREEDIDFVYKCKNDKALNSMNVGEFHPLTYEDASRWVRACINHDSLFHFWAIATNDDEQSIVGWVGLSQIDEINRSACFYSIVIGDDDYRDSFAWIETYLFLMHYVFEILKFHRLYGAHLSIHRQSDIMFRCMYFLQEGVYREAKSMGETYADIILDGILSDEYFKHLESGDYALKNVFRRLANLNRTTPK